MSQPQRAPRGRPDRHFGFNLHLAQEASFHAFVRRAGWSLLRPGRFPIPVLIGENPGISQTALGAAADRGKSTLPWITAGQG